MNTWIQIHLATFCAASVRSLLQVLNFAPKLYVWGGGGGGDKGVGVMAELRDQEFW